MTVLIADDDRTSRTMLTAMVRRWGYDPVAVEDGEAAWTRLEQPNPPKLLLLDWNMPVLTGLDVCRMVRAAAPTDPPYVILLTGRGDKGDIVRGLDAGANDYVSKPYDAGELQARLQAGRRTLQLQGELLAAQAALAVQATRDALTGLSNRRAILERLAEEISRAQRLGVCLSVGMCDVDHFKAINDTYGHQTGDDVLRVLSAHLQSQIRNYDCIGRYGGEEFLLIAPGTPANREAIVFERLCDSVAGLSIPTRTGARTITVSIGAAALTADSAVDALLADADAALYRAKADGRNRVAYAEPVRAVDSQSWGLASASPFLGPAEAGPHDNPAVI